jgi:hypothetical protein
LMCGNSILTDVSHPCSFFLSLSNIYCSPTTPVSPGYPPAVVFWTVLE